MYVVRRNPLVKYFKLSLKNHNTNNSLAYEATYKIHNVTFLLRVQCFNLDVITHDLFKVLWFNILEQTLVVLVPDGKI